MFGEPDHVTWGFSPTTRTLIWLDEGVMAIIERITGGDLDGELEIGPFFLFPPIDVSKLSESWVMQVIPEPPHTNEMVELPPEWQVEDPWRYSDD